MPEKPRTNKPERDCKEQSDVKQLLSKIRSTVRRDFSSPQGAHQGYPVLLKALKLENSAKQAPKRTSRHPMGEMVILPPADSALLALDI